MLVVQCRKNSSLSSMFWLIIIMYLESQTSIHVEDDGVFASYMADTPLQFHQPGASTVPVKLMPFVLHKFAII